MDEALVWRKFLVEWPKDVARVGVVVTAIEQIPFVDFMLSESIGLFERRAPDTVGGRRVLVPYTKIAAIKIVEPTTNEMYLAWGFRGSKNQKT
jgi:hypothetical protein